MSNRKPTDVIGGEGADTRMGTRQDFAFDRTDPLMNVGHSDLLKDAFPGRSQPIISDPHDGLPRPDDDRPQSSIMAFNEDTFVCIEDDRTYVEVFLGEVSHTSQLRSKLSITLRSRHTEDGADEERFVFQKVEVRRHFGIDVANRDGATYQVRPVRPRCEHYTEQLSVADDVAATPLYRWCGAYRTLAGAHWSTFDESILACTMRNPRDLLSEKAIVKRNREKIEQGKNQRMIEMITPDTDHEWERVKKIVDDAILDSCFFEIEPEHGIPSTSMGVMALFSPFVIGHLDTLNTPNIIVLPEREFQPGDKWFEYKPYNGEGKEFMAPGSGDTIARIPIDSPEYTSDDDADTWPAFNKARNPLLPMQIMKNAEVVAAALRNGKIVHVIGESIDGRVAFFAALVLHFVGKISGKPRPGLECLDDVQKAVGRECVTNFTHRMLLKRMT